MKVAFIKKRINLLLLVVTVIGLLVGCESNNSQGIDTKEPQLTEETPDIDTVDNKVAIQFADTQMEAYVRQILGKLQEDITASDLEEITGLAFDFREIRATRELQTRFDGSPGISASMEICIKGDREIDVGYTLQIFESWEDLKYFKNLEVLIIGTQQVRNLDFLSQLSNLKYLNISELVSKDISAVKNCSQLEGLFLVCRTDNLADVSFLNDMTELKLLNISGNLDEDTKAALEKIEIQLAEKG